MIVFEKADYEPCQRKRGGIVAAMRQSIMGMTNSNEPVCLAEAAAQKENFVTPCGVAMSSRIVGLSCERFPEQLSVSPGARGRPALSSYQRSKCCNARGRSGRGKPRTDRRLGQQCDGNDLCKYCRHRTRGIPPS